MGAFSASSMVGDLLDFLAGGVGMDRRRITAKHPVGFRAGCAGRSQAMTQTYSGGCQCGKVRYEVQMDIGEVLACNCSRCGRLGSLLAFAPASQFMLLSGGADLTKFESNKHMIEHQFCSTYVRCVDGIDVDAF